MQGCAVTLNDEVVRKGERIYIKATATLIAPDGSTASCNAFAREAEEKKGCDSAQVTGATSSYARKYALNGLFAIDDTKDSDSETVGADEEQKATAEQIAEVSERCKTLDVDMDAFCKHIGVEFLADMTTAQYRKAVSSLNRKEKASK